jgi:hypothetical protein
MGTGLISTKGGRCRSYLHVMPHSRNADEDARRRVEEAVFRLGESRTKGDLGQAVGCEIIKFSLQELQVIGGRMANEVNKLPSPYREKIRPYFTEQLFGMHHRMLTMYHSGYLMKMHEPIADFAAFQKFLAVVPDGCFGNPSDMGTEFRFGEPIRSLFYYLISAFAMFVLDEPGHPVKMPFPGGFMVERRGSSYYCPIRDKEEDIPFSICNFCPAQQMEGV